MRSKNWGNRSSGLPLQSLLASALSFYLETHLRHVQVATPPKLSPKSFGTHCIRRYPNSRIEYVSFVYIFSSSYLYFVEEHFLAYSREYSLTFSVLNCLVFEPICSTLLANKENGSTLKECRHFRQRIRRWQSRVYWQDRGNSFGRK